MTCHSNEDCGWAESHSYPSPPLATGSVYVCKKGRPARSPVGARAANGALPSCVRRRLFVRGKHGRKRNGVRERANGGRRLQPAKGCCCGGSDELEQPPARLAGAERGGGGGGEGAREARGGRFFPSIALVPLKATTTTATDAKKIRVEGRGQAHVGCLLYVPCSSPEPIPSKADDDVLFFISQLASRMARGRGHVPRAGLPSRGHRRALQRYARYLTAAQKEQGEGHQGERSPQGGRVFSSPASVHAPGSLGRGDTGREGPRRRPHSFILDSRLGDTHAGA